ncbi:hypothetical protein EON64_14445 [archaeon]|nr:MAG: hypothetical protein EON64_14445 [archaeon]
MGEFDNNERSKLFRRADILQKTSAWMAILCAAVALFLIIAWANGKDTDEIYLGGLNLGRDMANWHPVLMTAGMLLCGVASMMTYRVIDVPKTYSKYLHALLHTAAIVFIFFGLYLEFTSKNQTNKHEGGGHYANLYTMHSLVGLSTVILYALNYFMALFYFLAGVASNALRKAYLPKHVFVGTFALVLIVASIESGIMDMQKIKGCSIAVDEVNIDPASTYHDLQDGCKVANGAGILTLLCGLFAWYAMHDYVQGDGNADADDHLLGNKY